MKEFKETLQELFDSYGISNIKQVANSAGIYASELEEASQYNYTYRMNLIIEHMEMLEVDPDDFEFHLGSIWKHAKDIKIL